MGYACHCVSGPNFGPEQLQCNLGQISAQKIISSIPLRRVVYMPRVASHPSLSSSPLLLFRKPPSSHTLSVTQAFHNHCFTCLNVLYRLQCVHHRDYTIAPIPKSMYYKGLTNALAKPQQTSQPVSFRKPTLVTNSNVAEMMSPAGEVKALIARHDKGHAITPAEYAPLHHYITFNN